MSIERKDYGEAAIVKGSNPTMRRVFHANTPESAEANGSAINDDIVTDNDDIQVGDSFLKGNNSEVVSAVSKTEGSVTSVTTKYYDGTIGDPLEDEAVTNNYSRVMLDEATFVIQKGNARDFPELVENT